MSVRCCVAILVQEDLLTDGEADLACLQTTLRRIYALIAPAFGSFAKPGLLCTLTDRLLADLADAVVGEVDSKMESIRMQKVAAVFGSSDITRKVSYQVLRGNTYGSH